MPAATLVIVNPLSQSGAARRRFEALAPRLREALGDIEVEWTRGPRDAVRIAREGARAGCSRVVAAGGDGTMSEVVTGLLDAGLAADVQIGMLPLGTGGDLRRTLGIPDAPDAAIACLAAGKTRPIDAGRVTYRTADGADATACFANVASFGISGLVDALVNEAPKTLGGTLSFLLGTLRALTRYDNPSVRVRVDGETLHEGPLLVATAANGRYFGGGMHVAPRAEPDDGALDAVIVPGLRPLRLLLRMASIYSGSHIDDPQVRFRRGARIEAEPLVAGTDVWLDIDGEPLGVLPATFEVLPAALTFFGCPV